jgi:phage terminase Nu1 subunit (DNA packaging protein)
MSDSIEEEIMEDTVAKTVDLPTISNYFNVHPRTIANWYKLGMPRQGREQYNVRECIEWDRNRCVQEAVRSAAGKSYVDASMAKIRREVAEAELKEIEVARERGTLVNISDAEKQLERELTPVRNALLGFPRRIAPYIVMVPDEIQAAEIMEDHIRDLMDSLANKVDESIVEDSIEDSIEDVDDESEPLNNEEV